MPNKPVKKIAKFLIVFLIVVGISFSNVPFWAIMGAIDSFEKAHNIVDKGWHLSHNSNVVDKFTSYRNLAEKVKVYEAYAASLEYVGGAEAAGNSANYNVSLTGLTGGSGSAAQAGDLVIVATGFVRNSNLDPGVGTAGYTEEADLYQNDTRDANFSVNWKIMGGSPDTAVSCNGSTSTSYGAVCVVQVWRNADQTTPMDVTRTTAQLNNSAVPNSPSITPVTSGAVVISAGLGTGAAVDTSVTAPTGYGNKVDISVDPSSAATVGIASKAWSGSGAEDPAAWTTWTTSTSDSWAAVTLAIRPANDPPILTVTQPDGTGDTVTVGDLYNITYDLADADNVVTAAMYYDTDAVGLNGTAITGACATAAEGTGATCSWDTTGMTPGTYYVYGITNDGVNPAVNDYSPGVITINAPANALTVSTSGTQATNLNSGDTNQHIGGGSTAAFQLQMSGTAVNVNSVTLTEQGTVTFSDLASQRVYYESASTCTYNGSESNVSGTPSGESTAFSFTSVSVPTSPNYLCLYFVANLDGTNAVGGETIEVEITNPSTDVVLASGQNTDTAAKQLTGTTTVKPQITGYTNSTEAGLNYAGSCTGCGARIGGGATYRQTVVISGYGFGSDPGLGSRDTATNKVEVVGASTTTLADDASANTNVSAWSATSVTIRTDTSITGNADADWGTNFGGASALKITAGGQAVPTNLNFYVFPQVTSLVAVGSNAAREYDSGDTDGVVTVNGTRFGTASTGGWVRILGCDSSTCSSPSGSVTTTAWNNTSITAQVPTVIADNAYTGSFIVQQGNGTNNKQHQYTTSGFRVLPRITSITPSADGIGGDSRTVNGNHFCQSGSCLSAASWNTANDDGDDVKFGTTNATVTGTPSDTAVAVTIPTLSPGAYTVTLYSNSYASNGESFTYLNNTPSDPSSLNQYQSNCTTAITDETATTSTTVCLKGNVTGGLSGGTLYLQVEVRTSATTFTDATAESSGAAAPAGGTESVSVTPGQGTYKWRARTCHNNGGTHNLTCTGTGDYPSTGWVEFETGAVPTNDFTIDSNGPAISNISSGSPGEFSVTITWTTDENATSNVNYGTTTTGPYSFIAPNPADATADNTSHSVSIATNLNCGTTYYYVVKSADAQSTLTTSSEQTFTTGTCNPRVMKSVEFDWVEETSPVTVTTQQDRASLSAAIQESSDADFTIRSAVLEMRGVITGSGGSSPTANLWINSASTPTAITLPNTTIPQAFTIRYLIPSPSSNLNISPLSASTNTVHFQFGGGFTKASLVHVKLIITYDYTP